MRKALLFILVLLSLSALSASEARDLEGRWFLAARTPIGVKYGYLDIAFTDQSAFEGTINIFKHDNSFSDGVLSGDGFSFSGTIRFIFSRIPFKATGTIREGYAEAVIEAGGRKMGALASRDEEKLAECVKRGFPDE